MNAIFRLTLILVMFITPFKGQAKQSLTIGVGNFPPFFIEKDDTGLFLDITKAIFEDLTQYEVSYIYLSNNRLLQEINNGVRIDVACNIFKDSNTSAYLSEPIFRYTDVAISKKSQHIKLDNIYDLQNVSISAYQGAKDLLGKDFKAMALANSHYMEHPHPKDTTLEMLSGKKDVRIGDINIFYFDLKNKQYKGNYYSKAEDFDIHYLWPAAYSHMAFKDKNLRDAVNIQIEKLSSNGTFDKIYQNYKM